MDFWTKIEGGLQSRISGVSYENDDEEQTWRREVCGVLLLLLLRPAMSAATLATHAGAASHQGKAKHHQKHNREGQTKQQSRGVKTTTSNEDKTI